MRSALRSQVLREWQPFGTDPSIGPPQFFALDRLVPKVMKGLGLEQRLHQSQVYYLWPDIVGADIARHAQPVGLQSGRLIVAVDHPIWLYELSRYHKTLLLQKIQQRVGPKTVRDIVFRIG